MKAKSWLSLILGSLLALGSVQMFTAHSAEAAAGGTVSGVVYQELWPETNDVMAGVVVEFYNYYGSGALMGTAVTDDTGFYSIDTLPAGSYSVRYVSPDSTHTTVWAGNMPYELESGVLALGTDDVTLMNAVLSWGGSISGTIAFQGGAEGQAAASAFLYDPSSGQFERFGWRTVSELSGSYSITGLPGGTYLLKFGDVYDEDLISTEYWEESDYVAPADPIDVVPLTDASGHDGILDSDPVFVDTLAGDDRFGTAVEVSQIGFPDGADVVFITNGLNFPDALSAGPAAAALDAPMLLVTPSELPTVTKAEIVRLNPLYIIIVGGEGTVHPSVASELAQLGAEVHRLAGADRYLTSLQVAYSIFGNLDQPTTATAYFATGGNFPDALAAGPAASNEIGPVILQPGGSSAIDGSTEQVLFDLGINRAIIAGGPGSFSNQLEQSLVNNFYINQVQRRSGPDRYSTAVAVNKGSFRVADTVFLATGSNFPDALAGSALAGNSVWKAPIYLVEKECVPVGVLDEISRLEPTEIYFLGGQGTLGAGAHAFTPCQ